MVPINSKCCASWLQR